MIIARDLAEFSKGFWPRTVCSKVKYLETISRPHTWIRKRTDPNQCDSRKSSDRSETLVCDAPFSAAFRFCYPQKISLSRISLCFHINLCLHKFMFSPCVIYITHIFMHVTLRYITCIIACSAKRMYSDPIHPMIKKRKKE